jgi:uncharacterized protein (TIGR02172 family)
MMNNDSVTENPLAEGRTAEIYPWGEGWVLKLFRKWVPEEDVIKEARLARMAHQSGIPSPAVGETVKHQGRYGLAYEYVPGKSMLDHMMARPWLFARYARKLADLQWEMHAGEGEEGFPPGKARLSQKIHQAQALPDALKKAALRILAYLPPGHCVCHGDFHPGNLIGSGEEWVIIDWIDATCGNPLADVARTSVIFQGISHSPQTGLLQKILGWGFLRMYLVRYFQLSPWEEEEYRAWLTVVAAARLSEGIGEIETWLLKQVEQGVRAYC